MQFVELSHFLETLAPSLGRVVHVKVSIPLPLISTGPRLYQLLSSSAPQLLSFPALQLLRVLQVG